jgi:transposase
MVGRKEPAAKLFYQFSLEARVPPDHLRRRVAAAVDFSFVRRLTARFYSHTGQPSVDPVALFELALLGYLYGIPSERRLAEEAALNPAYLWFLGYDLDEAAPDHSALSKARKRFGPVVYQAFFTEVVRQCERAGLVRGDRLFLDSTLVGASADLDRVGSRALVAQLPDAGEHVARLWRDNPDPDPVADPPPAGAGPEPAPAPGPDAARPTAEAAGPSGEGAARLHLAGPGDRPNPPLGPLNARLVSRTDPEAEVVKRARAPADLYSKVHIGVDGGRARIVTAVEATGGAVADEHLLPRLVAEHEGNTRRAAREVAADTKYGTIDNYLWREGRGTRAAIPPREASGEGRAVPNSAFRYDPASDTYTCPAGATLRRQGRATATAAHPLITYRPRPADCAACPLKAACCGDAEVRSLTRADDGGTRERATAYLGTAEARRLIGRRKAWVETIFGDAKERRGLRRARGRGLGSMRIQALLTATAQNVRQLALRRPAGPAEGALRAPVPPAAPQGRPRRYRITRPLHRHPLLPGRSPTEFGNSPYGAVGARAAGLRSTGPCDVPAGRGDRIGP